jgi:hypothetical protein
LRLEGAQYISKVIKTNFYIQYINLHGNDFGKEGSLQIAEAIKSNSTLKKLNLSFNGSTQKKLESYFY